MWSFSAIDSRNLDSTTLVNVPPTASLSHRSSLGMMPFIRTRSKDKVVCVALDDNDGSYLHLATSTEKGEANVWDVAKGEIIISIPSSKIHKSTLPRSQRDANPQITSLMLLRNTLVCGTSCGLIRVFDMRSSRLTHRLAGHPGAIVVVCFVIVLLSCVLSCCCETTRCGREHGHKGTSALVGWEGRDGAMVGREDCQDSVEIGALRRGDFCAGDGRDSGGCRLQSPRHGSLGCADTAAAMYFQQQSPWGCALSPI